MVLIYLLIVAVLTAPIYSQSVHNGDIIANTQEFVNDGQIDEGFTIVSPILMEVCGKISQPTDDANYGGDNSPNAPEKRASHGSQQDCVNQLQFVKSTITQQLVNEGIPVLDYECVNGGKKIDVSFDCESFYYINFSRINDNGYLVQSSKDILAILRGSFTGLSDDGLISGTRHSSKNIFLDSSSVRDLKLIKRLNVASIIAGANVSNLVKARINGPLNFLQIPKSNPLYCFTTTLNGWESFSDPEYVRDNYLACAWRANDTIAWANRYSIESTKANRLLARLYPNEYNISKVDNWHRDIVNYTGGSFAPPVVDDDLDLILTGDNSATYELWNDNYYNGIPDPKDPDIKGFNQANGGPIIKEGWNVNRQTRHYQRGTIMGFSIKTGKLKLVERFADAGTGNRNDARTPLSNSDQGFFSPFQGLRMSTIFDYQGEKYAFTPVTMLDNAGAENWLATAFDVEQVKVALKNGNIERHYAKVIMWKIVNNSTGMFLEKLWTRYGHPRFKFAGSVNPYNPSEIFANDTRALDYSIQVDGCWAQGSYVRIQRGTITFNCGNMKMRPEEDVKAAWDAIPSCDPVTGGCAYPKRSYYDWVIAFNRTTTAKQYQQVSADFMWTRKIQQDAINAINPEADEVFGNSVVSVFINNGSTSAIYHHTSLDLWQSYNFQMFFVNQSDIPRRNRFGLAGEGGDNDYPYGCLYHASLDKLICIPKDSTIEILNPDTLKLEGSVCAGIRTSAGTANYGATLIDDDLFLTINNNNAVGYAFGNLAHRSYLDSNNEPVIELTDPTVTGDNLLAPLYRTEKSLDPGFPKKRVIDARQMLLVRVSVKNPNKPEITGVRTLNTINQVRDDKYVPFPTNIFSVNDLVFVPGGFSGTLRAFDAKTMETRFEFDAFADLKTLNPQLNLTDAILFTNSAPVAAGIDLYWCASEVNFQGSAPGKYCYHFSLRP